MPHKHPNSKDTGRLHVPNGCRNNPNAAAQFVRKTCEQSNNTTNSIWGDDSEITKYTIHWDVDHEMSVSIKNKNDDEPYIPEFLSKPFTTPREEINLDEARVIDVLSSMPSSSTTVYDYDNKRNRQLNVNDEQTGILPHMPHKIPVERKLSYLSSGDPTSITYLR